MTTLNTIKEQLKQGKNSLKQGKNSLKKNTSKVATIAALATTLSTTSCQDKQEQKQIPVSEPNKEVLIQAPTPEVNPENTSSFPTTQSELEIDEFETLLSDEAIAEMVVEEEKIQESIEVVASWATEKMIGNLYEQISEEYLRTNKEYLDNVKWGIDIYLRNHKRVGAPISEKAKAVIRKYNSHVGQKDQITY